MKKQMTNLWVWSSVAASILTASFSLLAQTTPPPPPLPPNTTYVTTSNSQHFKKVQHRCTSEPISISLTGISHQSNGGTTVGPFTVTFGAGVQLRTECATGGNDQTCQLINCQGTTMVTLINILP